MYNQNYITEKIRELIEKQKQPFAVLISKPDNFKDLNDTYGHYAGDRAIRIMAREMRNFIGDDDHFARFKGNAMALLLPGTDEEKAYKKAEEIQTFLNQLDLSELTGANPFHFTASIGISLYPNDGADAEDLVNRTHELPLVGRKQGGNRILFQQKGRGNGEQL